MKQFIIRAMVWCMRLMYAPMKLQKTKKKLVWLSRQSAECSQDMAMLSAEITKIKPEMKQVFRLRRLRDEKSVSPSYLFALIGDLWHLASATLAVTDTYSIPLSCLHHKKSLTIVQIWHALGAVKQFGLQAAGKTGGRDSGVAKAMCMHKNYHVVIAPSSATADYYCRAFGCTRDTVRIASLPRVDVLLAGDSKRDVFLAENPQAREKRLLLYVPTFREQDSRYIARLYDAFANRQDCYLIVSPHPLSEAFGEQRYGFNGDFSTYDLMKLADGLITDYSACSIEGALLQKPLWFFVPDYDRYGTQQGLNVNLKEWFPTACFEQAEALVQQLDGPYDFEDLARFSHTFVTNQGTNNTARLAQMLCDLVKK